MSISDRWHKNRPGPGDVPCREHSRGSTKLYPTRDHLRGDRWLVRWRDENGEQRKRGFAKKQGKDPETCAEAFEAERTAGVTRGDWIDPRLGKTPFADYAPTWMKSRVHKPTSEETYQGHLRNHIYPAFGKYGLAAIKPTGVQTWVKELQSIKGLAPSTIETIYGIFASIMRGAARDGYIRATPCVDIRLPEKTPTVVRLLTADQVLALADAVPRRYKILVLLGAGAGLRQGEVFGLALDRVHNDTGMITVDQQVVVIKQRPVLGTPKTKASERDAPMPDFLRDAIKEHVSEFGFKAADLLCRTSRGTLFRRDYFNRYIWKPAIKKVGLPEDTTFHDLRHTFASTSLAEGVPISEVSRWLGHKSITTTVDLYGHLVPEASARARDAIDGAFAAARAKRAKREQEALQAMCPQSAPDDLEQGSGRRSAA